MHHDHRVHPHFLHAHLATRNIPLNVNPILSGTRKHQNAPTNIPQSLPAKEIIVAPKTHRPKNPHAFGFQSNTLITKPKATIIPINNKASRYSWFISSPSSLLCPPP